LVQCPRLLILLYLLSSLSSKPNMDKFFVGPPFL
jgi:hypothetical protein